MQNKLDPRQYTPYSLITPSGNLSFIQGIDFFNCYLHESLTGNFNFIGSAKLNGQNILAIPSPNTLGGDSVSIFNSINCFATGTSNSIVSSDNSQISGDNNAILGGSNNQTTSASHSTILGGRSVVLSHTGASILADGDDSRQKNSVEHNSLTIDFSSGLFIKNNTSIDGDLYLTGGNLVSRSIYVPANESGFFSGDIQVLGNVFQTGSPYQNLQNLRDASGSLVQLNASTSGSLQISITGLSGHYSDRLFNTGANLLSIINNGSGALKTDYDTKLGFTVKTTGNQLVNGIKDFRNGTYIESLTGQHGMFTGNFVLGKGRPIPTVYNSFGISGTISFGNNHLFVCTGHSAWARIFITGW